MIRPFVLATSLLFAAHSLRAQLPIPSIALVGGASHYSLNGSGSTPFGALRVDIPLLSLVGEGSVGAFRPKETDGTRTYIIPEAQLQYQLLPMLVRPYVGVGGGWLKTLTGPDPHRNDVTLSASAGVRFSIPIIPIGLRAEARVRRISGGGHATELTVGGHL